MSPTAVGMARKKQTRCSQPRSSGFTSTGASGAVTGTRLRGGVQRNGVGEARRRGLLGLDPEGPALTLDQRLGAVPAEIVALLEQPSDIGCRKRRAAVGHAHHE